MKLCHGIIVQQTAVLFLTFDLLILIGNTIIMVLFLSTSPHFLCHKSFRSYLNLTACSLSVRLSNLTNVLHHSVIVIFVSLVKL